MPRSRETKLHQRDEALASRQKLGFFAQLAEQRHCFRIRFGPMIFECSRIHPAPTTVLRGCLDYRKSCVCTKGRTFNWRRKTSEKQISRVLKPARDDKN